MKTLYVTGTYKKWLGKLKDTTAKTIILGKIARLEYGLSVDAKHVGQGVFEIRIHLRSGYRVYYVEKDHEIIVLLCGGNKSSQKHDIEKAKAIAQEWEVSHD